MAYKSYLKHYDTYIRTQRSGNPWRQKGGLFGFKPRYSYTVEYQHNYDEATGRPLQPGDPHYGEKYYQEYLTPKGRERYEYELQKNRQKDPKKRADEDALLDPQKWEQEDLDAGITAVKSVNTLSGAASTLAGQFFKDPPRGPRYDLSNLSDQELRAILNREQMERQYNDYFNPQQVNHGREYVQNAATTVGAVATVGLTALEIAKAIKSLR